MPTQRTDDKYQHTLLDAKTKQRSTAIYPGRIERHPPEVGIFDPPLRCFKINKEWWAIVAGMVDWLSDVDAWPDAIDESYPALAEIRRFMIGADCVDCDEIINCITSDSGVATALNLWMQNNTGGGGYTSASDFDTTENPLLLSQTSENLIPSAWVCDNDEAYGLAKCVVSDIHNAANGVLNAIEGLTDPAELIGTLVDNVEVASWLGSVLEIGLWMQNELSEDYNASWSMTVLQDELFCDLYCRILENCELSFDILDDFYKDLLPSLPSDLNDFKAISAWLVDLVTDASKTTIAVFHWYTLQCLRFRSSFGQILTKGYRSLENVIAACSNESDGDWVLCDDCPTDWCYEYDFTSGELGWRGMVNDDNYSGISGVRPVVADDPSAVFSGGWQSKQYLQANGSEVTALAVLSLEWVESVSINGIEMDYDYTDGTEGTMTFHGIQWGTSNSSNEWAIRGVVQRQDLENGSDLLYEDSIAEVAVHGLYVAIRPNVVSASGAGSATLKRIRVHGTGANTPPGATECS